jgi:hypothetical protein
MGTLKTKTSLEKAYDLLEVSTPLIHLDNSGELFGVHNDLQTTNLSLWAEKC